MHPFFISAIVREGQIYYVHKLLPLMIGASNKEQNVSELNCLMLESSQGLALYAAYPSPLSRKQTIRIGLASTITFTN